ASEHPPLQRADGTFANASLFSFGSRREGTTFGYFAIKGRRLRTRVLAHRCRNARLSFLPGLLPPPAFVYLLAQTRHHLAPGGRPRVVTSGGVDVRAGHCQHDHRLAGGCNPGLTLQRDAGGGHCNQAVEVFQVSRKLPPQLVVVFQLSNLKLDVHRGCSGWAQAGPDGSRGESPLLTTRPCLRSTRGGPLPSFLAMPFPDSGVFIASQFSTGLRFRLLRVFD